MTTLTLEIPSVKKTKYKEILNYFVVNYDIVELEQIKNDIEFSKKMFIDYNEDTDWQKDIWVIQTSWKNDKDSKLKEKINICIIDFSKNIFNSSYYRKPLKNLWKNIHELEIGWDIRILIELIIIEYKCYFLNIWTHSSLNLVWNKRVKL